jgi:hypothetical protein
VVGAVIVITVERHIEKAPEFSRVITTRQERQALRLDLPLGALVTEPPPPQMAEALARIPETRLRNV